uniref:Uncharacterized protein n=1 Tax=Romanomermis culicivorax TaxID=13658 RepID=A0A915KMB9_ROMCU
MLLQPPAAEEVVMSMAEGNAVLGMPHLEQPSSWAAECCCLEEHQLSLLLKRMLNLDEEGCSILFCVFVWILDISKRAGPKEIDIGITNLSTFRETYNANRKDGVADCTKLNMNAINIQKLYSGVSIANRCQNAKLKCDLMTRYQCNLVVTQFIKCKIYAVKDEE